MAGMVIIGSGECGVRAAFALRELGYAGPVTLVGEEGSLPYERPPLSKSHGLAPKAIRGEEHYRDANIDLRLGRRAADIDLTAKEIVLDDGNRVAFDRLLIATGARPRLFPGMEGCLTLRTDADAAAIMQRFEPGARIGIIGGGFIGLELAATARQRGAAVTVFEAGPRLLGRAVPAEIAAIVHDRHASEGVTFHIGHAVASADGNTVTLAAGSVLSFDAVIAGVGALPETALAERAGLRVADGIIVDANFQTSAPGVHAAGDCCRFSWRGRQARLESWKAAQDQGAHVAAAMLGQQANYGKVPWFWSDQYDLTLQVAGLFDLARPTGQRRGADGSLLVFQCDAEGRLLAAAGIGAGNVAARDVKILERLIERCGPLDPARLSDPSFNLKTLLRAA